ncbi:MAG TPA: VWA domain-containing protein, partial [Mycobacterium sp.]|nr:VWA domain-containing protein [Mycobacterium sp.]
MSAPKAAAAPQAAGAAVQACGNIPLDVEIILDTSGSMGSNYSGSPSHTRLYWAQQAADQLVDQLQANGGVGSGGIHEVGLTTFSGTTSTVRLALGASDATTVKNAINATTASGNTPFKTGMATGAADLTAHKRTLVNGLTVKHVIIFLSDGRPNPDQSGRTGLVATNNSSERPTQANLDSFRAAADSIYSIAIGSGGGSGANLVDLGLMQLLAKSDGTSGGYYNVVDASLLPTLFSTIFQQIACTPSIAVSKTSDHATANPGDKVTYTITVTNNGNGDATNVPVSDDLSWIGSFGTYNGDCTGSCTNTAGVLSWSIPTVAKNGGSVQLTFSVTLASSFPVGTTNLTNVVVVTGSNCAAGSANAACSTTTTVNIPANPALTLKKSATQTSFSAAGDKIDYSYLLTNSGNVTLSGPFSVADDKATVTCPATATLAPGASITCNATYTVVAGDVSTGSVTNHATGQGSYNSQPVYSNQDQVTVPFVA